MESKFRIKRRLQLEDALDEFGSIVCVGEKKYKFLPYWFEFTEDSIYAYSLGGQIPEELKLHIESKRNGVDSAKFSTLPGDSDRVSDMEVDV